MAHPWEPEHAVGPELAALLIAAQFPSVPVQRLERLGEGWDNDVWLAGDVVFRFPRRGVAVPLLATEGRALPALASLLPVAIPVPTFVGRPTEDFPYPFLGYRLLTGETGDRAGLSDAERHALAAPLGAFLRALHGIDVEHARSLGVEDDRFRSDLPRCARMLRERLPLVQDALPAPLVARLTALETPASWPGAPRAVLHGDLYLRHLLFDTQRRWTAVIDWGDLCIGDPAVDLAVVYTALPAASRPEFFEAYGNVDPWARERARITGLARHAVTLLAYARDRGDAPLEREAASSIARAAH